MERPALIAVECQGNQRRPRFRHSDTELTCEPVTEIRDADFRDGQSAGRDYNRGTFKIVYVALDVETTILLDARNDRVQPDGCAGLRTLLQQHVRDLL